jgi:integrase
MAHISQYSGGRWRAVIRRTGYKVRSAILPSKKLAETWAREIEAEMDSRRYKDPDKHAKDSVGSIFEKFRDEACPARKGGRWEIVRINKLLREAEFMQRRITELKSADIREWRNARLRQVSPQSVNREMNLVSSVFTHAIEEWDYAFPGNPVHEVGRPDGGGGKPRYRRWSDDELKAICAAAGYDANTPPTGGVEYVPWALMLMIETAMRPGEFCAAKVGDVNLKGRCLVLHDSKNGDARKVPLSTRAVEILKVLTSGKTADQQLIPMTSQSLSCRYREVRTKAGLKGANLRFYDGKHEAISRLSKKFANVLELSAVTGHRSLQSLKHYYNPTVEDLASKLD